MTDLKNVIIKELNTELIYAKKYKGNGNPKFYMNTNTLSLLSEMFCHYVNINKSTKENSDSYTYEGVPIEIDDNMTPYTFECR